MTSPGRSRRSRSRGAAGNGSRASSPARPVLTRSGTRAPTPPPGAFRSGAARPAPTWPAPVAAANKAIRALVSLARVICGDETPLRAGPGPKAKKKYLQVACTDLLTCYFLGDRDLPSFRAFVYSDLHGTVVVHDRYQNYDAFDGLSHQLCCCHFLRDIRSPAQDYPDAAWPGQAPRELRALIHAANVARDQGLDTVPGDPTAAHRRLV